MLKLAKSDDKEEYFEIKKVRNQTPAKINPIDTLIENNIPTYVATPFPPLNLSQIGKTWPKNIHNEPIKI